MILEWEPSEEQKNPCLTPSWESPRAEACGGPGWGISICAYVGPGQGAQLCGVCHLIAWKDSDPYRTALLLSWGDSWRSWDLLACKRGWGGGLETSQERGVGSAGRAVGQGRTERVPALEGPLRSNPGRIQPPTYVESPEKLLLNSAMFFPAAVDGGLLLAALGVIFWKGGAESHISAPGGAVQSLTPLCVCVCVCTNTCLPPPPLERQQRSPSLFSPAQQAFPTS